MLWVSEAGFRQDYLGRPPCSETNASKAQNHGEGRSKSSEREEAQCSTPEQTLEFTIIKSEHTVIILKRMAGKREV
jgi:hypothetical protein